jgi:Trk-type K+ transport system membrane component
MFLSGASFALHFTVFKRRDLGAYWRDTEFKPISCSLPQSPCSPQFTCGL